MKLTVQEFMHLHLCPICSTTKLGTFMDYYEDKEQFSCFKCNKVYTVEYLLNIKTLQGK